MARKTKPKSAKQKKTNNQMVKKPIKKRWANFLDENALKEFNVIPIDALLLDSLLKFKDIDNYLEVNNSIYYFIPRKDIYERFKALFDDITYADIEMLICKAVDDEYVKEATTYYIYNGNQCNRKFYRFTDKFKKLLYDETDMID